MNEKHGEEHGEEHREKPTDEDWEVVNREDVVDLGCFPPPKPSYSYRFTTSFNLAYFKTIPKDRLDANPPELNEKLDWQTQSTFFRLPTEVRHQIYQEILTVQAHKLRIKQADPSSDSPTSLAVLETCRRIASEAAGLFYQVNHLLLTGYDLRRGFLRVLSTERRAALRRVTIMVRSAPEMHAMLQELQLLPNLEYLCIERRVKLRFTNVTEWVIMGASLKTALGKLERLETLRFTYSQGGESEPSEEEKAERLKSVESMLVKEVGCRETKEVT